MKLYKISFPLFLTAGLFLLLSGCGLKTEEIRPENKVLVETSEVVQEKIAVPVHAAGKLSSKMEMKLSFKTGGIVDSIFFDEGMTVKKGQLLAQLDLSEINAQVDQTRAGFEKAGRDLARVQKLYEDRVVTLEQLQDATTALDIASSELKVAEFNLRHSSIHAPTEGKILKRFVEPGELVGSGAPVFLFGSGNGDWIIRTGVTDRDIIRLKLGDRAYVTFDMYPGMRFPAYVSEIAETADPMSGTFEIELTLERNEYRLVSGFIGKVEIVPSSTLDYFIIPVESLVDGDGRSGSVYVLDDDARMVRKTPVQIGYIFDEGIAISSGLKEGEKIITTGTAYLTDGAQVKVVHK